MLQQVTILSATENKNPKFVKTELLMCQRGLDGKPFPWEAIKGFDSVHVLVVNTTTEEIIVVEQVRVPVLANDSSQGGRVVEMCAGLVDKSVSLAQIAKEEVLEECGYDVPVEDVELLKSLKSSVGTAGTNSHAFIVEVTEDMKVSEGGGLESEDINVIRIPFAEVDEFFFESDRHTDAITMFLVTYWLMQNQTGSFNNISNSTISL